MERRHFIAGALAAAPLAAIDGAKALPGLSSAVTDFVMKEVAEIMHDIGASGEVKGDHARRTARALRLLDMHMEETGTNAEIERRIRNGERFELDAASVAADWERYGLVADREQLSKCIRITDEDYRRARAELEKGRLRTLHEKLLKELEIKARELDSRNLGKMQRVRLESAGSCLDCFCRFLRIEAAVLVGMAAAGCAPCGLAASELLAIEALLEYLFQVCSPNACSNEDMLRCGPFAN